MSRSMVFELWKQRAAWAREARTGKKQQENARLIALSMGSAGALLGTVAGILGTSSAGNATAATVSTWLGVTSAVLISLGGYFGRELLTPERETAWARARIVAEALQREYWLYAMNAGPYTGKDRAGVLEDKLRKLVANAGLLRGEVPAEDQVTPPQVGSVEEYIERRVVDQAGWYEKKAIEHRMERRTFMRWMFGLGGLAVAVSVVGTTVPFVLAFVPVLTTLTAALVAWIQANRIGALVSLYQDTATQLSFQVALWNETSQATVPMSDADRQNAIADFVERCEDIMAQENGAWQAEWLSKEKAAETLAALQAVTEEAKKSRGAIEDGRQDPPE